MVLRGEIAPEICDSARGARRRLAYAGRMAVLTADQIELLQRARDGMPMWDGSMTTNRLSRELDLWFAPQLIEPAGTTPYRLTAIGAVVLEVTQARRMSLSDR